MREPLNIALDVANALRDNRAVVALESTVIAHGLPRPQNLQTAHRLQELVREAGAVPATIGVIDGKLTVGLSDGEIELLAEQNNIRKISTRDIAPAVANGWNGATTVASTIWIAHRSGIKVFATGGIGGVHRGSLPDISADLPELARTPIIVVCSGAKMVLDLPATREWLETQAVTVVGYQCDELPAFYSRSSGLTIDARVESPADVANIFRTQQTLGIESALLVVVPVPARFEVPAEELQAVLTTALEDAEWKEISGPALTPFLLSQMVERSGGATLQANVALLENNARVAAEIAGELV
ncbi:MAG TPA: pseudouridine-5'-phosphate glycosidase [Pyrinomonadaceae bacterium]|nr:pseudouridine-5'-phosphate glycosidase [Pyrinomonadaceae bacterium]